VRRYVEGGGTVVMGFFSGIVDENDHVRLGGYPAPWTSLLGLKVEEFAPLAEGEQVTLTGQGGESLSADLWADVIDLQGAEALATFAEGWYAGRAAVTRHRVGAGTAYYVGTRLDASGLDWLLEDAARSAQLPAPLPVPAGVEVLTRRGQPQQNGAEESRYLFVLNHSGAPVEVTLPAGLDLLTDRRVNEAYALDTHGVAVVRLDDMDLNSPEATRN